MPPRRDGEHLLRRPVPDDLPRLAALATELWGAGHADRFAHRWWWRDEVPHCWVAEHLPTGALGAICAQRRTRVLVGGRTVRAATVSDWYVSPAHAGAGLGQALVRQGESDAELMYTSAISDSAATGFRRLGWTGDRRLPLSAGPAAAAALLAPRPSGGLDIEVTTIGADDPPDVALLAAVDDVWRRTASGSTVMMVRDADHLRGHLALAGEVRYDMVLARRRGTPVGWLLSRTLPPGSLRAFGPARVGIVSDHLVAEGGTTTLAALVGTAARRWRGDKVRVVTALAGLGPDRSALARLGLVHPVTVGGRMLGVRMSNRTMHQPYGGTSGPWHLTFADNDTDLILGAG